RNVRARARARREVGTVASAQRTEFVQVSKFFAGGKLLVGDAASRMRKRQWMLSDIAKSQFASRPRRNELLDIHIAWPGFRLETQRGLRALPSRFAHSRLAG